MNTLTRLASLVAGGLLLAATAQAQSAPTIRVQCEKRGDRSVVSVDAKNLARGNYAASINSGGNVANAQAKASIGDEVEFDFSSQPNDIAAGAVAISSAFIVGGTVSGRVTDASGNTVAADTVACRVRR